MKKLLSVLLAGTIFINLMLSGCASQENKSETTQSTTANTVTAAEDNTTTAAAENTDIQYPDELPKVPKKFDSSVYAYDDMNKSYSIECVLRGYFNSGMPSADIDPVRKRLKEKYNVDFRLTSMAEADMQNNIAIRFSSGDVPDFVLLPSNLRNVAATLDDQGQLLDPEFLLKYMPTFAQQVTKPFKQWASANGKMFGLPRYNVQPDNSGLFVREDWLKNLGMSEPANEDELFEYAKAVTFNDPDKDEEADTWFMGTGGGATNFGMMEQLTCMFGHPSWNVENNKINHPMLDGTRKQFLQFVKKLYDAKLLSPDWYTMAWEQFKSYTLADKIGMVNYPGWNIVQETYDAHGKNDSYLNVWKPIAPLTSSDGKGGMYLPGGYPDGIYIFPATLTDEGKQKRIAHLIDMWMYPNEEYWNMSQNSNALVYPDKCRVIFDPAAGTNIYDCTNAPQLPADIVNIGNYQILGYTLIWQVYDDKMGKVGAEHNAFLESQPRYKNYDLFLNLDGSIVSKLNELVMKNEINFVLGKRSFDDWDKYVEEWKAIGGQALMDQAAEQLGVAKQ